MSALGLVLLRWLAMACAASAAALLGSWLWDLRLRRRAATRALAADPVAAGPRGWKPWLDDLGALVGEALEHRLPPRWRDRLQAWLLGHSAAPSAADFLRRSAAWSLAGLLLGLLSGSPELACLLLGLGVLPAVRLKDAAARRVQAVRRALPDALDLLTACVQAGLGLDQALQQVAGRLPQGPLRHEWERTLALLRTGLPRREAFAGLETRSGVEEFGPVLRAILRSEARGVPLAPVLQAQARQMRRLRSLRVQKQAAQAPIKMLFPLMVFILPVVFLVVFGPIVLRLSELGF